MLTSWLRQLRLHLLPGKTALLVVVSAALGAGLAFGTPLLLRWLDGPEPAPAPTPSVDKAFTPLGRKYLTGLGQNYGAAWIAGAKALESGQSVPAALKSVAQTWDRRRTELYNRLLTPAFSKIVPEAQPEADTKPEARAALARAWRGLAVGLAAGSGE